MTDMCFDIKENGNAFCITDTKATFTVQLATPQTAQTVNNSNGVITNRDFAREIRNALTANGQLETKVTDEEIDLITNLAGMLGNDVTDHMSFISAYDDSLTDAESKSINQARGITSFANDASKSARIILSDNSDVTTVVHEMFHVALKYNQMARNELVKSERKHNQSEAGRRELRAFLNEHIPELKSAGFETVEDALKTLRSITTQNAHSDAKMQEVLTAMWEMFSDSNSKAKKAMPAEVKSIFQKLMDAFKNIYKNIKGRELMPERLSKAYAGFLQEKNNSNVMMQKHVDEDNTLHYDEKGNLNYKDVQTYLLNKLGIQKGVDSKKFILNKETGRRVNISISSINKMLSTKATKKSEANGLSKNQHNEAVANIVTLFENAHLEGKHEDKNKSPDIKSIENYVSDFKYDDSDEIFTAFFTVKTHTDENTKDKLYPIELKKIENASDKNWVENPDITELSHVRGFNNTMPSDISSVNNSSNAESSNAQILKQKIIDPELIKKLESEETIIVYRVMQLINGKLYPPMAEMVDGKRQEPTEMFSWYKADERPELAVPILNESKTDYKRNPDGSLKYYFNLVKTINGKKSSPMYALYTPYWHTSPSVLNDQFNAAYERPNLVVEVEIPKSELEGIYKAEKAADPTGAKMWKSGTVSTKLAALGKGRREVILSRYNKIIRIVPNAEVASRIKEMLEGTDIAILDNVVSPPLLEELIKQGVKIEETAVVKKYKAKLAASKEKESSTNILKQEKLTPEEKVAERIDNTYTFSDFAETDVENMIGADVYVSDALLDKYNDNEKVKQEKDDRSTMEVFLTDNDVRRTIVDNVQLSQRNKEVL